MNAIKAKETLLEIKKILDELKIPFFLLNGTCLGAYRDKKFIEWDEDIDLGIKIEDARKFGFGDIFKKAEYQAKIKDERLGFPTCLKLDKNGIRTDLVGMQLRDKERYSSSTFLDLSVVCPAYLFEKLETIKFMGEDFFVPTPVEEFLKVQYGEYWWLPQREKIAINLVFGYLRHWKLL